MFSDKKKKNGCHLMATAEITYDVQINSAGLRRQVTLRYFPYPCVLPELIRQGDERACFLYAEDNPSGLVLKLTPTDWHAAPTAAADSFATSPRDSFCVTGGPPPPTKLTSFFSPAIHLQSREVRCSNLPENVGFYLRLTSFSRWMTRFDRTQVQALWGKLKGK